MGGASSTSQLEGGDVGVEDEAPVTLYEDTRQMNAIGAPASQAGGGGSKRSRRYTRSASSSKSAAKSKGHYAAVRKTRRR